MLQLPIMLGFTTGLAVAGAAATAVPIAIHLLSRLRRRRQPWGAMRFILEAFRKHRRRLQLEQLLLLAVRCLILALLGLALAGPVLGGMIGQLLGSRDTTGRLVYLVVDDALSTRATDGGPTMRFERLRDAALGLLDELAPSDRVAVVRAASPVLSEIDPPTIDTAAVRRILETLTPRYSAADLPTALVGVAESIQRENLSADRVFVVVLSDFSRSTLALDQLPSAVVRSLGERSRLLVSRPVVGSENMQIEALWPRRRLVLLDAATTPAVSVELHLRRFAADNAAATTPYEVQLLGEDPQAPISQMQREHQWSLGQTEAVLNVDLPLPAGAINGEPAGPGQSSGRAVTVRADIRGAAVNALIDDDTRYAVVQLRRRLTVALVDDVDAVATGLEEGFSPRQWVSLALAPHSGPGDGGPIELVDLSAERLDVSEMATLDAAVVLRPDLLTDAGWSALRELAEGGGLVWVMTPAVEAASVWGRALQSTFDVPWQVGLEPIGYPTADDAGPAEGWPLFADGTAPEALSLLSADWSALLRPVRVMRRLDVTVRGGAEQVWLAAGRDGAWPVLAAADVGEGKLLLLAAAIDPSWTSLPTKPLFVPLLHEAVRGVLGGTPATAKAAQVICGERPGFSRRWSGAQQLVRLGGIETVALATTDHGPTATAPIEQPGVWEARPEAAGRRLAVNLDPDAADTRGIDEAMLARWLSEIGTWQYLDPQNPAAALQTQQAQTDLGWPLLWVVLGLALLETLLARRFSHADAGTMIPSFRAVLRQAWGRQAATHSLLPIPILASVFDRLFGLERLSFSDAGASLGWRFELPAWMWALIILAAAAVALWSYGRLLGPRPARLALAGVRAALLLVLVALLAGPMLVLSDEKVEEDWLLVLVDRSASMQMRDELEEPQGQPGSGRLEPISRDERLRRALMQQAPVFDSQGLAAQRHVQWLGFAGGVYPIDPPHLDPAALGEADGLATSLRTAIEQALQSAAGRPISGIVLFSDGRSPQATGADLVRRLEQQAVSVFTVPLGASTAPLDLVVGQVEAPEKAFVNDTVPVTAWIDIYPPDAQIDPARVKVRLVDDTDESVLDETTLAQRRSAGEAVRLSATSSKVGSASWRVEVEYDAPPEAELTQREIITDNNHRAVRLELIDRPIRVLYVDGYPRWEYRYLQSMLVREQSIHSSMLLLSADRYFAQEGDLPITRLPNTAEEIEPYDVVIIGDVPASYFSSQQMSLLRDHVATRGAGLLWVGGAYHTPRTYEGTPLEALLPMRSASSVDRAAMPRGGIVPRPTPLAEALSVLQLTEPGRPLEPSGQLPPGLPPLQWAQDLGTLKPTAEVLADAERPAAVNPADTLPLLVRLRYGAGESLYVATDDTWRWRYGRGELFFEQFWVQLVRMMGRSRLQAMTGQARLSVANRRLGVDQATVVELTLEDAALLSRPLPRVRVGVRRVDDQGLPSDVVDQIELLPESDAGGDAVAVDAPVVERMTPRRVYRATWRPRVAGELELRVLDALLDELNLSQSIEVYAPDDELRQTLPDHDRLAALAQQTGGQVVPIDELEQLVDLVPNRARKTPNDIREPLWNAYVSLIAVLVLLTFEWVGRKLIRLA